MKSTGNQNLIFIYLKRRSCIKVIVLLYIKCNSKNPPYLSDHHDQPDMEDLCICGRQGCLVRNDARADALIAFSTMAGTE